MKYEKETNKPIFFIRFSNPNCSFSWGSLFGLLWSAKHLNFGGEICEIRILSCSIQDTYTLGKVKNQVLLFYQVENKFQNFQGNLMI